MKTKINGKTVLSDCKRYSENKTLKFPPSAVKKIRNCGSCCGSYDLHVLTKYQIQ